jgi:O-antigen/teichoic acid export membrane protein
MNRVGTNILANYFGKAIVVLASLAFVPFYIRYLGIEAYGLIGFYSLLQGLVAVLDLGLSPTLNRELARLSARQDSAQQARDLVRTLEMIYWSIGVFIGIGVVFLAPIIAHRWIHPQGLTAAAVQRSVLLMGIMLALQWPLSFYEGGLMGLQRLVAYNGFQSALQVVRGVGAIAVLQFIASTVTAFFVWQVVVSAAGTILCAMFLWRYLPDGSRPRFSLPLLRGVWRFAAGLTAASVATVALTLSDKVILSRKLPLADFGYYNLAFVASSVLYYLIYPISNAIFPRLSQYVAQDDPAAVSRTYHTACQLMTVVTTPVAFVIALFAYHVMRIWTGNLVTAEHTAVLVTIATLGTLLNGFVNIPYALQLAYGWTRLALYVNGLSLVVQLPLLLYVTSRYGAVGAASIWLALNAVYFLFAVNVMYARLLTAERWRWYWQDVGRPLLAALAVVGVARWVTPAMSPMYLVPTLAAVTITAFIAAALAAPDARAALVSLPARLARASA